VSLRLSNLSYFLFAESRGFTRRVYTTFNTFMRFNAERSLYPSLISFLSPGLLLGPASERVGDVQWYGHSGWDGGIPRVVEGAYIPGWCIPPYIQECTYPAWPPPVHTQHGLLPTYPACSPYIPGMLPVHTRPCDLPGHVTPGHVTPGHVTPGHVTPGH